MSRHKLIYNNDGDEPWLRFPPPTQPEHFALTVDCLRDTQVDTHVWCVAGEVAYYPSKTCEMVPDSPDCWWQELHRFIERGIDPIQIVVERTRELGMAIFLSIRTNDLHHKSNPVSGGFTASSFWLQHQDWRLWDISAGDFYMNAALDYSYPEVRDRCFQYVKEVATNYDVDGIELDMGREPYFFLGHEALEKRHILTSFLGKIRAELKNIAEAKGNGRPIELMIKLPLDSSPQELRERGMDAELWMREQLADIFVMTTLPYNDYNVSVEPWQTIARESGVLFRPGLEAGPAHNNVANHVIDNTVEEWRGMAQNYWAQGVDGLQIYNMCWSIIKLARLRPDRSPELLALLKEVGDPATLRKRNKTFAFFTHLPIELELYRPAQYFQTVPFTVREPFISEDGGHFELSFRLTGFPEHGAVHYLLNGRRVEEGWIGYEYGLKSSRQFNVTYRSGYDIDAHEIVTLSPPNDWIDNGRNTLGFYLEKGPWAEHTFMKVYELEVKAIYRYVL